MPAIDISGGKLVRFTSEGPASSEAFGGDPLAAAEAFVAAGARWLHVVDVDLAFEGVPRNAGTIEEICAMGVSVQASGGLASRLGVDSMLEAGAARIVLGSAALTDRTFVEDLASRLGSALAVGIEVDGSMVRARGGSGVTLELAPTLEWLASTDVERYLVTTVGRVGALSGPDIESLRTVASLTRRPVIAAAGVASIEHLETIAAIEGVEGAVVGRAFSDGGLEVSDVLARFS